jgi:GTP pyrophosphokinase
MGEEEFSLPVGPFAEKNPFEDEQRCPTIDGAYGLAMDIFSKNHPGADRKLLDAAFALAKGAHAAQFRRSGEPYLFHPLAVVRTLAEWGLDTVSLVCGLLHDTVEDTKVTQDDIAEGFGQEVAGIVEGLTKLSKLEYQDRTWLDEENVRRLLVAMGYDVRVLLVKLADRLHNMRTISAMPEEKRRRIAHETMELYAPLANRLGMGRVWEELEELAFGVLEPASFEDLRGAAQAKKRTNATVAQDIQRTLESLLAANGVNARVSGRVKSLYSIWRGMGVQKNEAGNIYDWLTYRIICPDRSSCYVALGIVHALYKPIPGRIKDYISLPKVNGYQGIHTSALMVSGDGFDVHIQTMDMHEQAEKGIISRWTYRGGNIANRHELNQSAFLRWIMELNQGADDSHDLVANLKGELLSRQIQVFTPTGELRSLPEGSTPIDFAYSIHTKVGHQCVGAKVNGRMVQLRHQLKSGDRVEIITRPDHVPGKDWLTIAKSASAKSSIQTFIRQEERRRAILVGRDRLAKEARSYEIDLDRHENRAVLGLRLTELKMADWDAFYAAVGFDRATPRQLLEPILSDDALKQCGAPPPGEGQGTILVDGIVGIVFTLAKCCKPVFGDEIVGYSMKGRRVVIHRANCPRINSDPMPAEKRVGIVWGGRTRSDFDSEIEVRAMDGTGLLAAISSAFQKSGVAIQRVEASSLEDGSALLDVAMRVRDREHLTEVMGRIRQIASVHVVERVRGTAFGRKRRHA